MLKYIPVIIAALITLSCTKEEVENVEPVLEFESMTPAIVNELVEEIVIKFKYSDADGNLGENNSSEKNLFVTDSRNQVVSSFRVRELAPEGAVLAIEGSIIVTISPLVITDGSDSETGVFSIYMTDRAENKSNVIVTEIFTVNK
jgi:hypothetical protein